MSTNTWSQKDRARFGEWGDNIKINLKEVECLVQLAQFKGSVAGCCE